MMVSKAQVINVTSDGVIVCVLEGEWRDMCYSNLPIRDDVIVEKGQFVEVIVHPSGQSAGWPRTG